MENKIIYYFKTIKDIKFSDGFTLQEGKTVMFLSEENNLYHVVNEEGNSTRFFIIDPAELAFKNKKKERWPKSKIDYYNSILNISDTNGSKISGTPSEIKIVDRPHRKKQVKTAVGGVDKTRKPKRSAGKGKPNKSGKPKKKRAKEKTSKRKSAKKNR